MRLSDKAYKALKADIISCALEPGCQVTQPELVEKYGFGITVVREALQRLAQEGFVKSVPRFGYIVNPITISDVYELFEVRTPLEAAAARWAAIRGTDRELAKLAEMANFTYVHRDLASYSEFLANNNSFHRSVAVAAGNQRLVDLISKLLEESMQIFHYAIDLRDQAAEAHEEHISLARALLDRDPDRAEEIVRTQLARAQQVVLEALTGRSGRDLPTHPRSAVQV